MLRGMCKRRIGKEQKGKWDEFIFSDSKVPSRSEAGDPMPSRPGAQPRGYSDLSPVGEEGTKLRVAIQNGVILE